MGVVVSEATVNVCASGAIAERLRARLSDGEATISEAGDVISLTDGLVRLTRGEQFLHLRAEAASHHALAVIRADLDRYLQSVFAGELPQASWSDPRGTGDMPANFREMRVKAVRDVTPHMRRITLTGTDLGRFDSDQLHARLLIPPMAAQQPHWPSVGPDGQLTWPQGDHALTGRKYTIRRIDVATSEIDVDFVLHADAGPGAAWAQRARPGDPVGMMGPGGGGVRPADWYLLVGDETALPAIGRILESLPAHARGIALIEVADPSEEQPLETRSGVAVHWLHRIGAPAGTTTSLRDAAMGVPWPEGGSVFAWAGTEFETFRALRAHWRGERGLAKEEHLATAYWRRNVTEDGTARG